MSSMVCQNCGENPATFHLTEINEGEPVVLDFCEECATAQGLTNEVTVPSMLAQVVTQAVRGHVSEKLECPHCGITFKDFRRKGRLGCPMDYEVFAEPLEPMLRKMHDNRTRHRGRLPSGSLDAQNEVAERLLHLRRELNDAISSERYEEAARIRDEIQSVENAGLRGRGMEIPGPDAGDPTEI